MLPRAIILSFLVLMPFIGTISAKERHAGYYYPRPSTQESIRTNARPLLKNDAETRTNFVIELAGRLREQSYAPDFVAFAGGKDARKLIIVATKGDAYDTVYRARALLASLNVVTQSFPVVQKSAAARKLTFLDLCKMQGFNELTISDGKKFAHQIQID